MGYHLGGIRTLSEVKLFEIKQLIEVAAFAGPRALSPENCVSQRLPAAECLPSAPVWVLTFC
jgi:hypothetical protein